MNLTDDPFERLLSGTTRLQPLYIRVVRLPGLDLAVVDEIAHAGGWQRVGFYAPPGRDIGLQAEDSAFEPMGAITMVQALATRGIGAKVEQYGALGYRISGAR